MESNKFLDKAVLKTLKKKGLFRKGDFTAISRLCCDNGCNKDRNHIRVVMVEQGSTTQDVLNYITQFYEARRQDLDEQIKYFENL